MSRRRAFSLVEVLVVLSIGSTVLALAVGLVHQAMQVAETAQANSQRSLHVNRFLEQFRNDVHLGSDIELHSNQSLTIERDDHAKIDYRVETNRITRTQKTSDNHTLRDAISLSQSAHGAFDFDRVSQTASLRILTNLELHRSPPRQERFTEAILARTRSSYIIQEDYP